MRQPLLFLLFLAACPTAAVAGSGGSAYSIFGVGDLRLSSGLESAGRGGAELALFSRSSIHAGSPASWSRLDRVRLEAGVLYEGFNSSDGVRSLYRAAGTFHGAVLGVPISTDNGVAAVGGFMPYSSVNYNTYTRGSQAGIDYTINHRGTGGLGRGLLGLSWAPLSGVAVGAALDYYFGSLDRSWTMSATGAAGGSSTASVTSNGTGVTASMLVDGLERIHEALRPLSLGASFTSRSRVNTVSQSLYEFTLERDSSGETSSTIVLPPAFGVGAAYRLTDRITLAADYVVRGWEGTEVGGAPSPDLRDDRRFSIGGERAGHRDPLVPWADRVVYRAGFTWHASSYRPDGRPVNEWAVAAGAGFPFGGDSRLNLAVEYARRGSTGDGLIRDSILRVLLSLNISELWFVRPEEE